MTSWGFGDYTTELTSEGKPQLTITYPGTFSYRAEVLEASVAALRSGMDSMVAPLHLLPVPVGAARSLGECGGIASRQEAAGGDVRAPDSKGYGLVANDAGMFSCGDATLYESTGQRA